ncbi:MAG: hypothetical protein ACRCX2_22260 [Paraclostridium sp.]
MDFSDMGFSANYIEKQSDDIKHQRASGFPHIWCLYNSLLIQKTINHFKALGEAQYNGLMKSSYFKAKCIMKKIESNACSKKTVDEYGVTQNNLTVKYNIGGNCKNKLYTNNASCLVSFREYLMQNTMFHVCADHFMRLQQEPSVREMSKTEQIVRNMLSSGYDGSNLSQFSRIPQISRYLRAIMPICLMAESDLTVKVEGADDIIYPLQEFFYPLPTGDSEQSNLDKIAEMCKVLIEEQQENSIIGMNVL